METNVFIYIYTDETRNLAAMKRLFANTLVLMTLQCMVCCTCRTELNDIETYINERPDSALMVLSSIDVSSLKGSEARNYHHLLLAQAKDKCFIDETNDTLMLSVVDYYKSHTDATKLFKAYYYLGRIQQNAGKYADAMYSYTEAEQLLDYINDDYAKGLLYAQLGALNHSCFDFKKALTAFEQAYRYYDQAGRIAHLNFTKLDIGNVLYSLKDYSQAEKNLTEVLSWAADNQDAQLYQDAMEVLCLVYWAENDIHSLHKLLNDKYFTQIDETLIIKRSRAVDAALNGNYSKAHHYIDSAWPLVWSLKDSCMIYHMSYVVYKEQGDYRKALDSYESLFDLQDSTVREALQKPLQSVRNDYFEAKSAYNEQLLRNNKYRLCLAMIITLCVVISLVLFYRRRIMLKDRELNTYIELADDLRNSLALANGRLSESSSENQQQTKLLKEMSEQITILFSKQYELLDRLGNTYYETHGSSRDRDAIYQQVKNEIENFTTDKKCIAQLETIVNKYKDNVMSVVRAEMKGLGEMDYRLLCFLFAGFSAKAISVFTGDSTANIYMKKSRIKNKISKLSPQISSFVSEKLS